MRTRARFERAHCPWSTRSNYKPLRGTKQAFCIMTARRGAPHRHYKSPCGGYKMDVLYNLGGSKDNATTGAQRPRLRRLIPKT